MTPDDIIRLEKEESGIEPFPYESSMSISPSESGRPGGRIPSGGRVRPSQTGDIIRSNSFGGRLQQESTPSRNSRDHPEEQIRLSDAQVKIHKLLESFPVKTFMMIVILANTAQVVYESNVGAECRFEKIQSACDQESGWLKVMNWLYLAIYSVELGLRIFVHRQRSLTDAWDMFDFGIIAVGLMSEALGGLLPNTGILRLARLARLARAFRIVKLPHELNIMVHGFFSALKAISMGAMIVFMMLALWSIVAVETLHSFNQDQELLDFYADEGCTRCPKSWGSVQNAVFSFIQLMVMGEEWDLLAIPIIERAPWTICIFMAVFFTVVLGMTNLILAVIVEKALSTHDDDLRRQAALKAKERDRAIDKFMEMCFEMDTDKNGTLDLAELKRGFETMPKFRDVLHVMDVDQNDLEVLFHVMDKDRSGDVSYQEFAQELANVKSASIRTMLNFTKYHVVQTRALAESIASAVLSDQELDTLFCAKSAVVDADTLQTGKPSDDDDQVAPLAKRLRSQHTMQIDQIDHADLDYEPVHIEEKDYELIRQASPSPHIVGAADELDELVRTVREQASQIREQLTSLADAPSSLSDLAVALQHSALKIGHASRCRKKSKTSVDSADRQEQSTAMKPNSANHASNADEGCPSPKQQPGYLSSRSNSRGTLHSL